MLHVDVDIRHATTDDAVDIAALLGELGYAQQPTRPPLAISSDSISGYDHDGMWSASSFVSWERRADDHRAPTKPGGPAMAVALQLWHHNGRPDRVSAGQQSQRVLPTGFEPAPPA